MKKTVYNEEKAKQNPTFDEGVVKKEVFHKDYNLDKKYFPSSTKSRFTPGMWGQPIISAKVSEKYLRTLKGKD